VIRLEGKKIQKKKRKKILYHSLCHRMEIWISGFAASTAVLLFAAAVYGRELAEMGSERPMTRCLMDRMEKAVRGRNEEYVVAFDAVERWVSDRSEKERSIAKAFLGMKYVEWMSSECEDVEFEGHPTFSASGASSAVVTGPVVVVMEERTDGQRAGSASSSNVSECSALADLYDATDGPKWDHRTGWDDRSRLLLNCCAAYGVTCDNESHVVKLILIGNGLFGPIPSSISALSFLIRLYASFSLCRRCSVLPFVVPLGSAHILWLC
jgi:hypothetical protein